jgi:hypothetical protein
MSKFYKHKSDNETFSRIYLNGLNVTILRDDSQIDKLNALSDPAICTSCGNSEEYRQGLAFIEKTGLGYTEYYCGCKGWD